MPDTAPKPLTSAQRRWLTAIHQHDGANGETKPLPRQSIEALLARGLVEGAADDTSALRVTDAGLLALGLQVPQATLRRAEKRNTSTDSPTASRRNRTDVTGKPARATKTDALLALLRAPAGASLAELETASGWQAHSVRGFLSGTVRKRHGDGLIVERGDDGVRRYRLLTVADENA